LRQRPHRGGVSDFSVDQPHRVRSARTGRRGPADKHQAARAPWRQAKLVRQRRGPMRRPVGGLAVSTKLVTDAEIVQPMAEAVGMVEHFGQLNRLREVASCALSVAR
jgi:hypothetical protein